MTKVLVFIVFLSLHLVSGERGAKHSRLGRDFSRHNVYARLVGGLPLESLHSASLLDAHDKSMREARELGERYFASAATRRPVILVPGMIGTQLEGNWSSWPGLDCRSSSHGLYKRVWLNLAALITASHCTMSKLAMRWTGSAWEDQPNLQMRAVPGVAGCMYLDDSNRVTRAASGYWAAMVLALEAAGYQRDVTVIGAGYDWRLGANVAAWRARMQAQVEKAYAASGSQRVVLVGHSMGVMQTTLFLNGMSASWKSKYVHRYIAAAGPTLGAPGVIEGMLSGLKMIPTVGNPKTYPAQHFGATGPFIAPFTSERWPMFNVTIGDQTYSTRNMAQLFDVADLAGAWRQQQPFQDGVKSFPGVNVTLVFGVGKPTVEALVYPAPFKLGVTQPTSIVQGDGDGTVNYYSATYPLRAWPSEFVTGLKFTGTDHAGMVSTKPFLDLVLRTATELE